MIFPKKKILTLYLLAIFTISLHSVHGSGESPGPRSPKRHSNDRRGDAAVHDLASSSHQSVGGRPEYRRRSQSEYDKYLAERERQFWAHDPEGEYLKLIGGQHAEYTMNHEGIPEPPNSIIFKRRYTHFVGQIAKSGTILQIITLRGPETLSSNQLVIYNRLRSRHPTDPREFRIPPVPYEEWDKLMRKGVQVGVVVKDHEDSDLRMAKFPDRRFDTWPKHGDELYRVSGWDRQKDEATYTHYATFWRDMWLTVNLLPQNKKEKYTADELDRVYFANNPQNQQPHQSN